MINTRRAHQMTKMAMLEENELDRIDIVANQSKREYIGFWTVIYSVAAVLVYLLYTFIGILIMIVFFSKGIPGIAWIIFAVVFMSGFVFHTYYYVKSGRRKASKRYDESQKRNEYITEQYKILDEMYKAG